MTGKQKLFATSIASVGVAAIVGVAGVSAATSTSSGNLASKIATVFHLNQADVQKVIDQNRADHQAQLQVANKARLDAAVKAGTITQAQEDLIIAKQQELQAARVAAKGSTADPATRRAAMKTQMDALKQWATDNKIPMNLLRPMGGGHGPGGTPPTN